MSIAVASNFLAPLKYLIPRFYQKTGVEIKITAASTAKLYAQIHNGAPYDLFLSADLETPKKLILSKKLINPDNLFHYAKGRLALWTVKSEISNPVLLRQRFIAANFNYIAIANPKTTPYGRAAWQAIQSLAVNINRNKLVLGENVGQTFQFVGSGNADMGFVAYAQIKNIKKRNQKGVFWLLPDESYQPINQYGLILHQMEPNSSTNKFVHFLKSIETQRILKQKFGYL